MTGKRQTVTQARTRLCESMDPETMGQRGDIGTENEQDGVKGVGTNLSWRAHVFTRTGRSQAMGIRQQSRGPLAS